MIIQIDTHNRRDLKALQIVAEVRWHQVAEGAFMMLASNRKDYYATTVDTCDCPDSARGHVCKHRRAARLIEAHLAALVAAS